MFEKKKEKKGSVLVILVLLCLLGSGIALGDYEYAKVGKSFISGFGHAVGMDDEYAIIGAPGSKCAYIYEHTIDGWNEQDELSVPDEPNGFGASVAISGDLAVVGSVGWDDEGDTGKIWLFTRMDSGWEVDELCNRIHYINGSMKICDPTPGEQFGVSISIDADTVVVGAPGAQDSKGCVYVFKSSWVYHYDPLTRTIYGERIWVMSTLSASEGVPGDRFGSSVSVKGDTIVVGVPGRTGNGAESGAVYAFHHEGANDWQEEKMFVGEQGSSFGSSVCIGTWLLGEILAVGVPNMEPDGQVYVFYSTTMFTTLPNPPSIYRSWSSGLALKAWDFPNGKLRFGSSVSLEGNLLVVGAPNLESNGQAYLFEREPLSSPQLRFTNYKPCAILYAEGATSASDFGCSVAVSGDYVLAGQSVSGEGLFAKDEAIFYYDITCDVTASISVSPSTGYDFGNVPKDETSVKTFTISSSGDLDIMIDSVLSSNPHFVVKNAPTGENVPPDKTFDVEFLAGNIVGKHSGTITVTGISEFFPVDPVTLTVEGTTVEDEKP